MTQSTDIDVLIVGAGPTGLTMACLLAQYGIQFRIVEKRPGTTDKSKALGVQARTLELFEQLEIADLAVAQGEPAKAVNFFMNGRRKIRLDINNLGDGLTRYPYMLVLEQSKTEKLLDDRLRELHGQVEWQTELIDLQQGKNCVKLSLCHFGKVETVKARYVVAADGPHSIVRSTLQVPFVGGTYEHRYLLVDAVVEGNLPTGEFSVCFSKEGFAAFFPFQTSSHFRALAELSERRRDNEEPAFEEVARDVKRESAMKIQMSDPEWISTYKLHHRCVQKFQAQRCFFAGDAAHVHSPLGAQGMNTGIQDAFNLAWKLSWVLNGFAHESLLQTYHAERAPVARRLIRTTDQLFKFVVERETAVQWIRLHIFPYFMQGLFRLRSWRQWVFKMISQTHISYPPHGLNHQAVHHRAECRAGQRFPHLLLNGDIKVDCNDGKFHAFASGSTEDRYLVQKILSEFLGPQVLLHTLERGAEMPAILAAFGLQKEGLILLRPDQYVMYVSDVLDPAHLMNHLRIHFHPQVPLEGQKRNLRTSPLAESSV